LLALFAVPLPGGDGTAASGPQAPDEGAGSAAMRLVRRRAHLVALTPIGSFLLVAGSCQESWLEEAAGRWPMRRMPGSRGSPGLTAPQPTAGCAALNANCARKYSLALAAW
jgi:hypothetical protein